MKKGNIMKSQRSYRLTAILLLTFFFVVSSSNAADWPRWRGPNGDGISTETEWDPAALAKGPKILWKTDVGWGDSNVVIQGKYLYTMGTNFTNITLFCLNADSGKTIWQYSYRHSSGAPQSTPALDEDFIYSLDKEGRLCCFNARKGKLQ
jgi:outer membrane protein assembly factor BamB